jgi:hypothetical protein
MGGINEPSYFAPEDVESLREAFDAAWGTFRSTQRADANKTRLAREIMMLASEGERDPTRLRDYAVSKVRQHAAWLDLAG